MPPRLSITAWARYGRLLFFSKTLCVHLFFYAYSIPAFSCCVRTASHLISVFTSVSTQLGCVTARLSIFAYDVVPQDITDNCFLFRLPGTTANATYLTELVGHPEITGLSGEAEHQAVEHTHPPLPGGEGSTQETKTKDTRTWSAGARRTHNRRVELHGEFGVIAAQLPSGAPHRKFINSLIATN
jgi:hypothetical protein